MLYDAELMCIENNILYIKSVDFVSLSFSAKIKSNSDKSNDKVSLFSTRSILVLAMHFIF
jgi:hypothetical protein